MKVMAFNGSPRGTWNTATLLGKTLEGAASRGATTSLTHLYDLDYKGCRSCFACKTLGGKSYGACVIRDDLTLYLEEALEADALILGSPVYFWAVTGEMKSFMERLMFPYYRYAADDDPKPTLFPRSIPTAFIYTMGAPESRMLELGFGKAIELNKIFLARIFRRSEALFSCDTYQFEDYARIDQTRFNEAQKAIHRSDQFPLDCQRAYELGAGLVD